MDFIAFNLGLALLSCGRDAEGLAAYEQAGKRFPDRIESRALPDLEQARSKWLSPERAEPVIQLLNSLKIPLPG
jgi:hypothetical protein